MTGSITLRWTPTDARPRKVVFEPRQIGGFHRLECEKRDDAWRLTGDEIVSDVGLESPAAIITGGSSSFRGP